MKTLIRSVPEVSGAEYQLWGELYAVPNSNDLYALRFSSVWTGAKDPEAPQSKGEFFLQREDLARLDTLIKDVLR